MPSFPIKTALRDHRAVVDRGILGRVSQYIPGRSGKVFVVTTEDVWRHQGGTFARGLSAIPHEVIHLPGGEDRKRLAHVESAAEEMLCRGADRSSLVIAFGGGIVNDMGGFLAAIFMRGIPIVQVPTTLLAQVDAAIGGKTGVNLVEGKNLIGSFHQPLAVLIDPDVLATLPDREYRAGLFEVIKYGVIRSAPLFQLLVERRDAVLAREASVLDYIIEESVRIKAEVVSADERESDVRRILNFGHTFGHALEAETAYQRYLHGEAVGFGMRAATHLAKSLGRVSAEDAAGIVDAVDRYGPIPSLGGIPPDRIAARLVKDKKTIQGHVNFVLPTRTAELPAASGVNDGAVLSAIRSALA